MTGLYERRLIESYAKHVHKTFYREKKLLELTINGIELHLTNVRLSLKKEEFDKIYQTLEKIRNSSLEAISHYNKIVTSNNTD